MRALPFALCFLLAVSNVCQAQTSSLGTVDLSRGLTLPPTGASLVDQATAANVNPAGLTFVGSPEFIYMHERNAATSQLGDGVYGALRLFDLAATAVSVEWVRGTQAPTYRKTTWAFALGGDTFSFGAGFNFFSAGKGGDLDGMSSIDLGLIARPAPAISLGAVVKNVDAQSTPTVAFERRYDVSVGLRPFNDRYTLAVDYLWGENAGPSGGRMSYALQAEVLRGLVLGAGVSHGLRDGDDVLMQFSATLNTSHFGATYAIGGAPEGLDHVVAARVSYAKYRSLPAGEGTIAVFDLAQMLAAGRGALELMGFSSEDPYLRTLHTFRLAAQDPRLRAVVLKLDGLASGLAHMDELREAVVRLRTAGKRVVAVLLNAGDSEYLLASAADKIYTVPQAVLMVNGFTTSVTFLGGTMEKLGVDWDVARVGAYKNFPDQLTRSDMSAEQRESIDAYLDVDVRHNQEVLAQSRQMTAAKLEKVWKEGLLSPQRAWELGLVDEVVGSSELQTKLNELVPGARFDPEYAPRDVRETRWGERRKIAIVPVLGDITGGGGGKDPLGLAHVAGARTVVQALKEATDDDDVAAIVLRVDSPGGDGLASDLIYREVLEAKKKKPVVASMGNVAASGGYYVAMGADEIWAEPTTITGSIGVFVVKPALQKLAEKLGVHEDTLQRGELADMLNLYHPWSDAERQAAQRWVDAFYDDFITEVAKARKLDKKVVDGVARGRVWAGADALTRGLVDRLGGLSEAVDSARIRAGLSPDDDVDLSVVSGSHSLLASLVVRAHLDAFVGERDTMPLPDRLGQLAQTLGVANALASEPGIKARMPFDLVVR